MILPMIDDFRQLEPRTYRRVFIDRHRNLYLSRPLASMRRKRGDARRRHSKSLEHATASTFSKFSTRYSRTADILTPRKRHALISRFENTAAEAHCLSYDFSFLGYYHSAGLISPIARRHFASLLKYNATPQPIVIAFISLRQPRSVYIV